MEIELIQPVSGPMIYEDYIHRRGEGLHHIGYRVADCGEALEAMIAAGATPIDKAPRPGSRGTTVSNDSSSRTQRVMNRASALTRITTTHDRAYESARVRLRAWAEPALEFDPGGLPRPGCVGVGLRRQPRITSAAGSSSSPSRARSSSGSSPVTDRTKFAATEFPRPSRPSCCAAPKLSPSSRC